MNEIKHFMLPEHTNTLYEKEAVSSISLTKEVAAKINELVDAYNSFSKVDHEWKQTQEGTIRKGIVYMKDNLINTLHDLLELYKNDGTFNALITDTFSSLLSVYVTPEMFGAVGDGFADDTKPLQNAINYAENHGTKLLLDSKATYYVTSLEITDHIDIAFNGSTIKSKGEDFVIKYNCDKTPEKRYVISNVNIIGNKGLYLKSNLLSVSDITIHSDIIGIQTSDCYELSLHNIKVIGTGVKESIGFDLHCTDSSILNCITTNIDKCFILDNSTNYIYQIHGWNTIQIPNSTLLTLETDREIILNDVYCDCIENGIIGTAPKVTVNNFVYSFLKSLGGDGKKLTAFNCGYVEINGGYVNYTGTNNTFLLSPEFARIKNVEDRAGVCGFKFTGENGSILNINYENGRQILKADIEKTIQINLSYIDTFNELINIGSKTFSGYSLTTETINNVQYSVHTPVIFKLQESSKRSYLYLYHDKELSNIHLECEL